MNNNPNLHQQYYKKYFEGIDFSVLYKEEELARLKADDQSVTDLQKKINGIKKDNTDKISKEKNKVLTKEDYTKEILNKSNPPFLFKNMDKNEEDPVIKLKVQYPGLVTGVGIDHETKIEGEFKLGAHFDWTYGMPVIYGSSVKGVLRSALIAKTENGKIVEYNDYFLKQTTGGEWTGDEIDILFNDIFNGKMFVKEVEKDGKKIREYQNKYVYDRDVFFDAVIISPDKKGRILCSDSITPHGVNPLKNPIPITFLKIAPGCTIEFRFKLVDTKIGKLEFKKGDKLKLFEKILTTVGIGAKTNVGYGQLKTAEE